MENDGIHVIAFEDDASGKILSIGEFNNSTTDNALEVLKVAEYEAIVVNGLIQAINTDRDSQFYPNKKTKMVKLILFFEIILNQKELNIYPHEGIIHKLMARLKGGFKSISGIEINSIQQINLKISIMTEYMVRWNLNGVKLQMKLLL